MSNRHDTSSRSISERNSRSLLHQTIRRSDFREVEVSWPDHRGEIRGRRVPIATFVGPVLETGVRLTGAAFSTDAADDAPTLAAVPDSATFRRLPWRDGAAHAIADIVSQGREAISTAPRSVLRRTIERFSRRRLSVLVRVTVEGYVTDEQGHPLPNTDQRDSLTAANRLTSVLEPLTLGLGGFVPVSSVATGDGPGKITIVLQEAAPLDAADDVFRLAYALDELGRRAGLRVTLSAPPESPVPEATMHLQVSVWNDDQPVFGWGAKDSAEIAHRAEGSVRSHLPALSLFGAPSHGEDVGGTDDPVTWETGVAPIDEEPLHEWPAAARVGLRVAANAEPHWAIAALLGSVLAGLDVEEPPLAPHGATPTSLQDAVAAANDDAALADILGRDAIAVYAAQIGTAPSATNRARIRRSAASEPESTAALP